MSPCLLNIHINIHTFNRTIRASAHTSQRQFNLYLFSYISLLSRIQVLTFFSQKVEGWMPWAIGNGRLNTSPKLDAYTSTPSTPYSMAALLLTEGCLFSGKASSLDAFRSYPRQLSCSACPVGQLINQRLRCPVPLVLGATSPQTTTPLSGRDRPVSRRSKPSSRSPLMGEQPHPWLLLAEPGWEEPTSRYQTAGSMGALARDEPVIPRVTFLSPPAPNSGDMMDR